MIGAFGPGSVHARLIQNATPPRYIIRVLLPRTMSRQIEPAKCFPVPGLSRRPARGWPVALAHDLNPAGVYLSHFRRAVFLGWRDPGRNTVVSLQELLCGPECPMAMDNGKGIETVPSARPVHPPTSCLKRRGGTARNGTIPKTLKGPACTKAAACPIVVAARGKVCLDPTRCAEIARFVRRESPIIPPFQPRPNAFCPGARNRRGFTALVLAAATLDRIDPARGRAAARPWAHLSYAISLVHVHPARWRLAAVCRLTCSCEGNRSFTASRLTLRSISPW